MIMEPLEQWIIFTESENEDMLFHSLEFLIFFPVVVVVYLILPRKLKAVWLLAASYYFYMCWNIKHTILIVFSTVMTWICGLLIGKCMGTKDRARRGKWIVGIGALMNLSLLIFFKYFDFLLFNINFIFEKAGIQQIEKPFDIILPVGISFYTFQSLGYMVDVYRGDIEPEKNLLHYALFVSFFPQLVAGPIERSKNLLKQIRGIGRQNARDLFQYDRIASGLLLMLWGFFQKLVIADRLCVFVDAVYADWQQCGQIELVLATAAFSIQIYCDFASYSTIAAGAAKGLGFHLMENFRTPYFSKSIREFWRRWHISLSTWFKDYLYIPMGGSRCGVLRSQVNLIVTFLVSGLWHGASWHYVVWGAIHGCYQVIGTQTEAVRRKIRRWAGVNTASFSYRFGQVAVTYALSLFGLIFFRAQSLPEAFGMIGRIAAKPNLWALTDGTLYGFGIDAAQARVLCAALGILLCVSLVRELKNEMLDTFLARQSCWFRWMVIIILFSFIFLFGMYGPDYDESQFIYFQF